MVREEQWGTGVVDLALSSRLSLKPAELVSFGHLLLQKNAGFIMHCKSHALGPYTEPR